MNKLICLGLSALVGTQAIEINNEATRPMVLGKHLVQQYALSDNSAEETSLLESRLALMTRVTISNTHLSLKMDRNKEIAKTIALAMKEAIKAERKAERAQKEAEDEKKDAKDAKEATKKPAEDAAAKKDGAAAKDEAKAAAPAAEEEASEADKLAAEESEAKAQKMMEFARQKVESIVALYKELNENIKGEMLQLEKILLDTKINAEFDPDSEADIEWVTGEVEKILIDVPQIKKLEDKLKMADEVGQALDGAVEGLETVTNISKMIPARKEINLKKVEGEADAPKKGGNATKKAAAGATKKAPAADGKAKAKTEAKGDAKADAKAEPKAEAKADEKKPEAAKAAAQISSESQQDQQKQQQVFEFTIGGADNQPPSSSALLQFSKHRNQ